MDTLVNLQAFLATAEAAGFSAAARRLNVSTSVVSKRVTQLEAQIGAVLFHRSTRQLRLTEAGQRYVHRARSVVADVGDLLSRMGEKDHDLVDQLRIKAPTSLTTARLADILSVFQTQNPGLKLQEKSRAKSPEFVTCRFIFVSDEYRGLDSPGQDGSVEKLRVKNRQRRSIWQK